jgi:site-specific recombinase XerD
MGEITLRKALDDYKTIYMPFRNFADRTRVEYWNDIEDFVEFLGKAGVNYVKAIGLPNIERYVAHLEQEGFAGRTRKRKVVAIRSFLSFLFQEGYVNENMAKRIVVPFVENSTPHALTQSECNRLREACANNNRDRAIIELFFQTGIKLSELTHLTQDDIELGDRQNGYMRIKGGRGKKERFIPLNDKATSALRDYLDERKLERNRIIFLNRFGEALGNRGVQKMLRKHLKRVGIRGATAQTLRHTFGAQHEAKGTDPKTVQEVMGLKDHRSAAIYQSLAREIVSRELQENAL